MRTHPRTRMLLAAVALGSAALMVATTSAAASDRAPSTGASRTSIPVFVLDNGKFTTFDSPGDYGEFPRINDRGEIAGSYLDAADLFRGYLRDPSGHFTPIAAPGAGQTIPLDVNNRGQVVGNTCPAPQCNPLRGFLRGAHGQFEPISLSGSIATQAFGINDHGQVVGDYTLADGSIHGYLWSNGRFTTIDGPDGTGATLTAINNRGDIIGVYDPRPADPMPGLHGFLLSNGQYSTFAVPDAPNTVPLGLNDHGQIVGSTVGPDLATDARGFLLARGPDGPLTRIDVPGAPRTSPSGIDDRGRIVGLYENPNATPSPARASGDMAMPSIAAHPMDLGQPRQTR